MLAISRKRVTRSLSLAVLMMAGASLVAQGVRHTVTSEDVRAVARIFKMSAEDTIPAYFSALLLLASAGLFWVIACAAAEAGERFVRHWRGLAVIFTYMS